IDRDYINAQIFAGYGFAHTAMWNQAGPETARNPFFFHDLNRQYAYNYTPGRDMVLSALNASGAVYNGTWTSQGNPIVVSIVPRPRRRIPRTRNSPTWQSATGTDPTRASKRGKRLSSAARPLR